MPPVVAAAAIAAGGAIAGGVINSKSAGSAAKAQTDSANAQAVAQAKSAADALAFQREQAAQDLATANTTQKANYDQWAAKERRLGALGQFTGAGPREIPDYVPLTNVNQVSATPAQSAPSVSPIPGVGLNPYPSSASPQPSNLTSMAELAGGNYGVFGDPAQVAASRGQVYSPGISSQTPNGLVMMKAPTGQTKMVPAQMVPQYTQRGAVVIG